MTAPNGLAAAVAVNHAERPTEFVKTNDAAAMTWRFEPGEDWFAVSCEAGAQSGRGAATAEDVVPPASPVHDVPTGGGSQPGKGHPRPKCVDRKLGYLKFGEGRCRLVAWRAANHDRARVTADRRDFAPPRRRGS